MACAFASLNSPALPASGSPFACKLFRIRTYKNKGGRGVVRAQARVLVPHESRRRSMAGAKRSCTRGRIRGLGNHCAGLVGIWAFVATGIDRGSHVEVGRARLDGGIGIAQAGDQGRIELGIPAAAHSAAVDVVAAHRRRACRPSQRHGMGLTRGGGCGKVQSGDVGGCDGRRLGSRAEGESGIARRNGVGSCWQTAETLSSRAICGGCGGGRAAQRYDGAASPRRGA